MRIKCWEKWAGIIGLLIIIMPVKTVSAGWFQVESSHYPDGKSGYKSGVTYQDARVAEPEYIATNNDDNYLEPNRLRNEGLYDDNIQIWILIVLIVLGIYTLVAGFFVYFHFWKPGQNKNSSSSKPMKGYPINA